VLKLSSWCDLESAREGKCQADKRASGTANERGTGEHESSAEVERDARTGKQERVQDRRAAAQPPAKDKLLKKIESLNALQALTFCPA
jgi:hypothetical protein